MRPLHSIAAYASPLLLSSGDTSATVVSVLANARQTNDLARHVGHVDISPPPLEYPGLPDPSGTPLRLASGTPGGDR